MLCAAVGYLLVLGGTSAGQGWRLAPHLAMAHAGPPPPALVEALQNDVVLPTLRRGDAHVHGSHAHGAETHTHDVARQSPRLSVEVEAPGVHRHGDMVHDHRPPPERPSAHVVSLDKHRLPLATTVPAPLAVRAAESWADETEAGRSLAVETPPPVGRG